MENLMTYVIGIGAVGFFIWIFFVKSNKPMTAQETLEAEQAQMIGLTTGMIGGSISDAVMARYALQRFEQQYKRKATPRDLAIVVSMIHSMN
jgi:plastocyanin domain-containing protein